MARQSTAPVQFTKTTRTDQSINMGSARAGVVVPIDYIPLLAGDSCSGKFGVDIKLKEMPKPLLNGVTANVQAWFVPKSAHPKFSGRDELMHSLTGQTIKTLGAADRLPPAYFTTLSAAQVDSVRAAPLITKLGIHMPTGSKMNSELIDAFALIYNFRLAAHSSKLTRRGYAAEGVFIACQLPPAFWPSSRFAKVVPDYERALVVGALDLDVSAGQLPISGLWVASADATSVTGGAGGYKGANGELSGAADNVYTGNSASGDSWAMRAEDINGDLDVFAEMAGQAVTTTLADIDKARTTQSFAKLRTAYAGNDATGFDNDDVIVAHLMQGLTVPDEQFKRPWLLDSKRVPVGFAERHATDGANLDASVSLGRASATLSLNVPQQDVSGYIVITCELLPERIDERMADEALIMTSVNELPNALRDVQRTEPVDLVLNRRIDAKHTTPDALYGYEPMNDVWNRNFTRLSGDFYQPTPGGGWTENRSNIWQTELVDPTFGASHYLAPSPFPHEVFSDTLADAFEYVGRHAVSIVGLTQIGDVLMENNDEYSDVQNA